MTSSLLIKGGHVVDPSQAIDRIADVLVENGIVSGVENSISAPDGIDTVNASGFVVSPGFIDLHCHLREPGFEYKETIATGTQAAANGGFTTVCAMPNTSPVSDTAATIDFVRNKAQDEGIIRVLPIGCITKGSAGKELSAMSELAGAGAVGFSDDGYPVEDDHLMRQALSYSSAFGLPIINHCEVKSLSSGGVLNEGLVATRLGLKGIPRSAEEIMVARDIALADLTGGRVHIAHASTAGTVELVRRAKENGVNVTCEVTPHHLTLTEGAAIGPDIDPANPLSKAAYDTNAKVAPPLRSAEDVEALIVGLRDSVVDFVATDHAPHSPAEKLTTFEEAANGISCLETAFGSLMSLVHEGHLSILQLIDRLTLSPARFLGMGLGSLKRGSQADITIFDPEAKWEVDEQAFSSKGKNTPLAGATLKGKVVMTIFMGKPVHG